MVVLVGDNAVDVVVVTIEMRWWLWECGSCCGDIRSGGGDGCCGYIGGAIVVVVVKLRCVGGVVESMDVMGLVVVATGVGYCESSQYCLSYVNPYCESSQYCLSYVNPYCESSQYCLSTVNPVNTLCESTQDSIRTNVVTKYHEKKNAPDPCGHVFQRTGTI
ncbi:hypothetical protein DPMN_003474 [Dreissena polymorpha]|uniref:Uncharacterized protein n=1 Tax=Dreissena polymorpha TaxID=45954 RepID=A0A9D4RS53_DREPO|nr:hypothetical protein DPMN_003474 [Dreissena polymorpha]